MKIFLIFIVCISCAFLNASQDQTATFSPIFSEDSLPYTLQIDLAPFTLPVGLQSFADANYHGKWVIIGGRTNGLHTFLGVGNNFPPNKQNTTVYVVDPATGQSISRSLFDSNPALSQDLIDCLSTTAAEYHLTGSTLYIVGGYGINTTTGQMETKSTLTAVDLKKLIKWVKRKTDDGRKAFRQTSHPILQVTGGEFFQNNDHDPYLLILGQNFAGLYTGGSNGIYTQQIRSFWINDDGKHLSILPNVSTKTYPDYRRRDLNVVPVMRHNEPGYIAFAGVFTLNGGVWTVPIIISPDGSSFEPNPNDPSTFKQPMNQYICPAFGLYSTSSKDMYVVFPGGMSVNYFDNGVYKQDENVPFVNDVTTIKIDKKDHFTQHEMNGSYPFLTTSGPNPKQLYFGSGAEFFLAEDIKIYHNRVIQLDQISEPTVIGYIAGGISSTARNTASQTIETTASPYVFTVTLIPK